MLSLESELNRKNDILYERNRIAREIHDNLGHKLTSSILQISALQAINDDLKEPLEQLSATLKDSMEDIRKSIHSIHEQSLSIEASLEQIQNQFIFCPIYLDISIKNEPPSDIYYALLLIVKEACSNTAKHSQASRMDISLKESESFYQLLIKDNGKRQVTINQSSGIGLLSIEERVYSLGGSFHLNRSDGYHIFIRLPIERKGDSAYENYNN